MIVKKQKPARHGIKVILIEHTDVAIDFTQSVSSNKIINSVVVLKYNDSTIIKKINELATDGADILICSSPNINTNMVNELAIILHSFEKFASISPRGANMGLQSIPLSDNYDDNINDKTKSLTVFNALNSKLKKYNTVPFTDINFVILKGKVIQKFKLFDETSSSLSDALREWCFRLAQFGFSSLSANHHFVDTDILTTKDKILSYKKKYHYADQIINEYLNIILSPVEKFAPFIVNNYYKKPKVLLSLYHLAPVYNGTSEHAITMVNKLVTLFADKYHFSILISRENDAFFKISKHYDNVIYTDNITGKYHLGITFIQVISSPNLSLLNNICAKIISSVLDMISFRSLNILKDIDYNAFIKSINFSDGIITISNFTKRDLIAADILDHNFNHDNIKPIMISIPNKLNENTRKQQTISPFDKYILIVGNHYKHKAVDEIYPYLRNSDKNFVIIGYETTEKNKNIYSVKSGNIDYETVTALYKNASALLFPSEYEGFGLPVINAYQYGKKVVLANTEVNNEIKLFFKMSNTDLIMFDRYDDLTAIIAALDMNTINDNDIINYTYDDVAIKTEKFIKKILKQNMNFEKLCQRHYSVIDAGLTKNIGETINLFKPNGLTMKELAKIYLKNRFPKIIYAFKQLTRG